VVLRRRTNTHHLTPLRYELVKSARAVVMAQRGKDVIHADYVENKQLSAQNAEHFQKGSPEGVKTTKKPKTIHKTVSRYLDDYQVKLRLGKGAPATVERLTKNLVLEESSPTKASGKGQPANFKRSKSAAILNAIKEAEDIKPIDFSKAHESLKHNKNNETKVKQKEEFMKELTVNHESKRKDEGEVVESATELGYEAGTAIYFGATIALQVRDTIPFCWLPCTCA
jgi:hypothetical protein